jgi:hypothetical protein
MTTTRVTTVLAETTKLDNPFVVHVPGWCLGDETFDAIRVAIVDGWLVLEGPDGVMRAWPEHTVHGPVRISMSAPDAKDGT